MVPLGGDVRPTQPPQPPERTAPPAPQFWGERTGRCAGSWALRGRSSGPPAPQFWGEFFGRCAGSLVLGGAVWGSAGTLGLITGIGGVGATAVVGGERAGVRAGGGFGRRVMLPLGFGGRGAGRGSAGWRGGGARSRRWRGRRWRGG